MIRPAVALTATFLTLASLSLAFGFRDAPSQARDELTWRQTEILHVRARTHACTDLLGRPRFRVQDRIVRGGPAYRAWTLNLWRARARMYCKAARDLSDPARAICATFGAECAKAIRVARCESNLNVHAIGNSGGSDPYYGLFQQGAYSRATYGFGWTALEQARAAKRHRDAEGWGPWPICGRL